MDLHRLRGWRRHVNSSSWLQAWHNKVLVCYPMWSAHVDVLTMSRRLQLKPIRHGTKAAGSRPHPSSSPLLVLAHVDVLPLL